MWVYRAFLMSVAKVVISLSLLRKIAMRPASPVDGRIASAVRRRVQSKRIVRETSGTQIAGCQARGMPTSRLISRAPQGHRLRGSRSPLRTAERLAARVFIKAS